jgi:hypothetical protein
MVVVNVFVATRWRTDGSAHTGSPGGPAEYGVPILSFGLARRSAWESRRLLRRSWSGHAHSTTGSMTDDDVGIQDGTSHTTLYKGAVAPTSSDRRRRSACRA